MFGFIRRHALALAVLAAGIAAAGYAIAQSAGGYPIASPTGAEQIEVYSGTSPVINTVTVNQIRNTNGYLEVATGSTVNTTVPNTASKVLATGAITTWNVTLPTAPADGQTVAIACPGGTATAAVSASTPAGVTIVGTAFTTCTSGGAAANTAEYIYSSGDNKWYRIQ